MGSGRRQALAAYRHESTSRLARDGFRRPRSRRDARWPHQSARSGSREITDVFHGHVNSVNDLRFSRDGHSLLSASDDGSVRIWPVYPSPYEAATLAEPDRRAARLHARLPFPVQRVRLLSALSASAAESNYESCEKANGREPLHGDVLATVERQLGIDK